jgi:GTP cyclohydrolase I
MSQDKKDRIQVLALILSETFPQNTEWGDSVGDTARRILDYWQDFAGEPQPTFNATVFKSDNFGMVAVGDIEFASLCAHHLLPFYGKAYVGYIPHGIEIGVSKIPRIVGFYAKRPQVQERMTQQIAKWLQDQLNPKGSIVVIKATHTCMACRGIESRNSYMVTSCPKGVFLSQPACRDEFFSLIGGAI